MNSLHVQPQGKAFLGITFAVVSLKIFTVFLLMNLKLDQSSSLSQITLFCLYFLIIWTKFNYSAIKADSDSLLCE